jgi:hypothetical protein
MATGSGLPCDGVYAVHARLTVPVTGGSLCCSVNAQEESHMDKNTQETHSIQRAIVNVSHPLLDLFFSSWMCLCVLT